MVVDRAAGANKKKEVAVWSVVFLSDNTVISGDSAGKVQVWDSQMGTLIRTHLVTKWDVMALAVSRVSWNGAHRFLLAARDVNPAKVSPFFHVEVHTENV